MPPKVTRGESSSIACEVVLAWPEDPLVQVNVESILPTFSSATFTHDRELSSVRTDTVQFRIKFPPRSVTISDGVTVGFGGSTIRNKENDAKKAYRKLLSSKEIILYDIYSGHQ